MPLSLAFSTPLNSRSLPQISLICTDIYGFGLLLAFGRNLINLIAHFVRSMFSEIYYHRSSYRLSDTRALNLNYDDSEKCTVKFIRFND